MKRMLWAFALLLTLLPVALRAQADDAVRQELERLRQENEALKERVRRLEEAATLTAALQQRLQAMEEKISGAAPPAAPAAPANAPAAGDQAQAEAGTRADMLLPAEAAVEKKKFPVKVDVYGMIELDLTRDSNDSDLGGQLGTFGNTVFDLSPAPSRVGVRFGGPRIGGWDMAGRVEVDFNGVAASGFSLGLRLRHGYYTATNDELKLRFLFGQTDDLVGGITQNDAISFPTESYTGDIGNRRPQIRAEKWFEVSEHNVFRFQVAEAATYTMYWDISSGTPVQLRVNVPMVEWRTAFEHTHDSGKVSLLAFYGSWGRKTVRMSPTDSMKYTLWSVGGEAQYYIQPGLLFMGEIWRGVMTDMYRLNVLLLGQDFPVQTDTWGGWGSLTWWPKKMLRFNLGAGFDLPTKFTFRQNTSYTWFTNFYYDFDEHWEVGAEFSRWYSAKTLSDNIRSKNRIQGTFIYRF